MTSDPIAVLFVLQTQEKGVPDNRVTSEPIAVLFVLQTQQKGIPDNRVTSEPIAVLFVLQTQDKASRTIGRRRRRRGRKEWETRPREKTYNLQQTLGKNQYFFDPGRSLESPGARPGARNRYFFLMHLIKDRYFFDPGRSQQSPGARPGAENRYFS